MGSTACPTGWTPGSARAAPTSPAASAPGSAWPAPCWPTAPVLVLDEPTAHLDAATADQVADDLLRRPAPAVVWITHGTVGLDRMDSVLSLPGADGLGHERQPGLQRGGDLVGLVLGQEVRTVAHVDRGEPGQGGAALGDQLGPDDDTGASVHEELGHR